MYSDAVTIEVGEEVVSCAFGEGLALLDLRSGQYFSLNSVGAFIWSQLEKPTTVGALRRAVVAHYDAAEERCLSDLDDWLGKMAHSKLIKTDHAAAA
ncbi:MAG: PqqD family protein [Hyphomonadaceae bacterium]